MCVVATVVFHLECPRDGLAADVEKADQQRTWVVLATESLWGMPAGLW